MGGQPPRQFRPLGERTLRHQHAPHVRPGLEHGVVLSAAVPDQLGGDDRRAALHRTGVGGPFAAAAALGDAGHGPAGARPRPLSVQRGNPPQRARLRLYE